jgi:hypothetical protein
MTPTQRPTHRSRRRLSVSIAEELAAYAVERAGRERRPVSDVVNESLELLRRAEADALAEHAYAADAGEAAEWAERAVELLGERGTA